MTTYVITGANRGIGLELAKQLSKRNDTVIALCRSTSKELDELGIQVIEGVDVSKDSVIPYLKSKITTTIDVVINNAGILFREGISNLNWDQMRTQFEINSLGPLRVTTALRPLLNRGSKIAIITSRMGSVSDNSSGRMYGYRMSKAAVNMAGKSLAIDLQEQGISVALLHPGYVRTGMTGGNGFIDADESAEGLIQRIDSLSIDTTGSFWHSNGEELPW
jgi:NAD(P)-dependent dehydrogenase (short-subunit alcohol dehydrogenase family)